MKLNTLSHGLLRCNLKDVLVRHSMHIQEQEIFRFVDELHHPIYNYQNLPWITVLTFIGVNGILDDYNTNGTFNRVQYIKCFQYARRLYQFARMHFGLRNALSTFKREKNNDLRGLSWNTCLGYLDSMRNVATYSTTSVSIGAISVADLTLKHKKWYFAIEEMEYLGHELSSEGVRPFDRLMTANFRRLRTQKRLGVFHLAGYNRTFVKDFGAMMTPLMKMLRKNVIFVWTAEQKEALNKLSWY
ncbi:LOW QUALITY PROTEIN: hypothetical protein PHMEG_0006031 [Phytophthora megakarya]|uniref:Uncharacterized protein n=1 Tax=Phytophthora megakarya TaxID=4795 RepID=A0A225WRV3_9STRA|nr:LOW QUALITY PROTEIN: hypothetical protein PHMEG_0006031 [Phytophthora megakarya]